MKIVYIESCYECPLFDDEYYTYASECTELNRKIKNPMKIPDDCPLEDSITD